MVGTTILVTSRIKTTCLHTKGHSMYVSSCSDSQVRVPWETVGTNKTKGRTPEGCSRQKKRTSWQGEWEVDHSGVNNDSKPYSTTKEPLREGWTTRVSGERPEDETTWIVLRWIYWWHSKGWTTTTGHIWDSNSLLCRSQDVTQRSGIVSPTVLSPMIC